MTISFVLIISWHSKHFFSSVRLNLGLNEADSGVVEVLFFEIGLFSVLSFLILVLAFRTSRSALFNRNTMLASNKSLM